MFRQRLGEGRCAFCVVLFFFSLCYSLFIVLLFCAQHIHNICIETYVSGRAVVLFLFFFCYVIILCAIHTQHLYLHLFVTRFRNSRSMMFSGTISGIAVIIFLLCYYFVHNIYICICIYLSQINAGEILQ